MAGKSSILTVRKSTQGGIDLPSLKRRLLVGGGWALFGKVAGSLTVLTANGLLARLLSPKELGMYFLAISVVSLGSLIGSLGLNQTIVRFVAGSLSLGHFRQTRRMINIILVLGILGSLGVGLAYLPVGRFVALAIFNAPALASVTALVGGWMVVTTLGLILAEAFRGFHDIRLASLFTGAVYQVLLLACLITVWAVSGRTNLTTVVLFAVVSGCATVLLGGWILHRKVSSLPQKGEGGSLIGIRDVLSVSSPLLVVNLAFFIVHQADLWIMGASYPQQEVAIYGAAAWLVNAVGLSLGLADAVVAPMIAEMYEQGKREKLERVLRLTATLAGVPALLGLAGFLILGRSILGLIYGDFYRSGWSVLVILGCAQFVFVITGSCNITLIMTGFQRLVMRIYVASGVAMIVLGLCLVRPYGAIGVAVAAALSLAAQNVLLWYMAKKRVGISTHMDVSLLFSLVRDRFK